MPDSVIPCVSVVMPVFNAESHLRAAIDSILSQTLPYFEFIVVDDGSSDGTGAILASYTDPRLIVVRHERNRGIVAALNVGIATARCDLIARQDADDVSLPRRFELQVAHMAQHPEVSTLATRINKMDERGSSLGKPDSRPTTDLELKWALLFANHLTHSSVMFRREAFERGGRYRESDRHVEDYGLWTRIARFGSLNTLDEPLLRYRYCADAISRRYAATQRGSALRISAEYMKHTARNRLDDAQIRFLQAVWRADSRWLSDRRNAGEFRRLRTIFETLMDGFCVTNSVASATRSRFRAQAREAFAHRILRAGAAVWRDRDGNAEGYRAVLGLCWHASVLAPRLTRSVSLYRTLARPCFGNLGTSHNAAAGTNSNRSRSAAEDNNGHRAIDRVAPLGSAKGSVPITSAHSVVELLNAEDSSW